MTPALSEEMLARVSAFATATFALRFPPDRWNELARGVAAAALELGISDLQGWTENLISGKAGKEHLAAVANHLTISETYFFRHRDTFVALEKSILPVRLTERRQRGGALRIWSAGCATGEEPYTIAILLRQKFPELGPGMAIITGTDLNSHVLARARRGVYSEWSFRDAPEWLKPAYFTRQPSGRYDLNPEIRQMVRFVQLNLAAGLYPAEFGERGDLDVILCRNVLMYFSAEWQDKIIRRFARALVPGGWLIVGPCDITAAQCADLHLQPAGPGIYQKPRVGESAAGEVVPNIRELNTPIAAAVLSWAAEDTAWRKIPTETGPFQTHDIAEALERLPAEGSLDRPAVPLPEQEGDGHDFDSSAVARGHADRGELADALEACDQAIAKDKIDPRLYHLRACILLELNRVAEAEDSFRRMLFLEPNAIMAEFALGSLAQRRGRLEQARHHFSIVVRRLASYNRGDAVPYGEGLTAARLREVVEETLRANAA